MNLPIENSKAEILDALSSLPKNGRLVLSAPTGSGKSTRIPVWCWQAGKGPVLVIEPRRIACRTLADWVARGLGQKVGATVGFSVRYEQRYGADTEILFVTPGVARRYLAEASIDRYRTVIFDEFHERSWETDVLMAALAAQPSQRGQHLVLMSATLGADQLVSTYQARRVESFGRSFPVEVSYQADSEVTLPSPSRLVDRVTRAIEQHWDREGGTLVFLPGLAAMRDVQKRLPRLPVRLLHGTFAHSAQDSAFGGEAEPRIVLATNVAESSLTIPGITTVIDSGLEKRPVHQAGYVALATVPIAVSSAEQRAGRAGRTAPGRCIRLWDPQARLQATRPPDLERMELDELLLFLSGLPLGLATPLHWVDLPPTFAWDRALVRLVDKGLVDGGTGLATRLGRAAASLPVETDWARILALAPRELQADLCDLYALSSSKRSMMLATADQDQADQRRKDLSEEPWRRGLSLLRLGEARQHGLDAEALAEGRRLSRDLQKTLGVPASDKSGLPHPDLGLFLARHWPERHFVRRQTRDAWGNGEVECRTARGEELPEDCLAALFLQVEPVIARGLKVELRGRWALPTTFSLLRKAGYGQPELSKIRFVAGKVSAKIAWNFAGRLLAQEEQEVSGDSLRQALVQLTVQGSWNRGLWEAWQEHAFYLELRASLDGQSLEHDPRTMLLAHLRSLGVAESGDLALLEQCDLLPPLDHDKESAEALKKAYPRQYLYGGVVYDLSYLPQRRRVLLTWRSGPRGVKPNVPQLPRWNGWGVDLDERGRLLPLR